MSKKSTKYRIVQHEYVDEHGHVQSLYFPQKRVLFIFWCNFAIGDCGKIAKFNSMSAAKEFIAKVEYLNGNLEKDTIIEDTV